MKRSSDLCSTTVNHRRLSIPFPLQQEGHWSLLLQSTASFSAFAILFNRQCELICRSNQVCSDTKNCLNATLGRANSSNIPIISQRMCLMSPFKSMTVRLPSLLAVTKLLLLIRPGTAAYHLTVVMRLPIVLYVRRSHSVFSRGSLKVLQNLFGNTVATAVFWCVF